MLLLSVPGRLDDVELDGVCSCHGGGRGLVRWLPPGAHAQRALGPGGQDRVGARGAVLSHRHAAVDCCGIGALVRVLGPLGGCGRVREVEVAKVGGKEEAVLTGTDRGDGGHPQGQE